MTTILPVHAAPATLFLLLHVTMRPRTCCSCQAVPIDKHQGQQRWQVDAGLPLCVRIPICKAGEPHFATRLRKAQIASRPLCKFVPSPVRGTPLDSTPNPVADRPGRTPFSPACLPGFV